MAKYSEKIISLRKIAQKEIIKILEVKPAKLDHIYKIIKEKNCALCDESIKCTCGNKERARPEWKHQIRWALQDLRYNGQINYEKNRKEYSLMKK